MPAVMARRLRLRRSPVLAAALLLIGPLWPAGGPAANAEGERMFAPCFREGAPSDALVQGPPRLSRGHLNAFVDLFEAAFDLALPRAAEQDLRDHLEEEFQAADTTARETFLSLVESIVLLREHARKGQHAALRDGLRRFRTAVDQRIRRASARASHRVLTHMLERRHQPVWLGEPVVKGLSVDAYVELVEFVAGLGRNQVVTLTPGMRSALVEYLGRDLRPLGKEVRQQLADVHRTWLWAKARWDRAKEERRFLLRWEAVKLLARLVPRNPPLAIQTGTDLPAYAREAAKVAAAQSAFDAVTALARNPDAVLQVLTKGLELERERPSTSLLYR